jgi:hypothetical protein
MTESEQEFNAELREASLASDADLRAEIAVLRKSITTLRNAHLRLTVSGMPDVVHLYRSAWVEAFAPLIVEPYNKLKWEQD